MIKHIPEKDWLDITEQTKSNYTIHIGRAPKNLIVGNVLDYEVISSEYTGEYRDYVLYSFLVKKCHTLTDYVGKYWSAHNKFEGKIKVLDSIKIVIYLQFL